MEGHRPKHLLSEQEEHKEGGAGAAPRGTAQTQTSKCPEPGMEQGVGAHRDAVMPHPLLSTEHPFHPPHSHHCLSQVPAREMAKQCSKMQETHRTGQRRPEEVNPALPLPPAINELTLPGRYSAAAKGNWRHM